LVACRSAGVDCISLAVEFGFSDHEAEYAGWYGLDIPTSSGSQPGRHEEWLRVENRALNRRIGFNASEGKAVWSGDGVTPQHELRTTFPPDHLFLDVLADLPFLRLADSLRWIGTYNFYPEAMWRPQKPNPGSLQRDGGNLGTVFFMLRENDPELL
jgi:hypothetical protein